MLVGVCLPACGAATPPCTLNWFTSPCLCTTTAPAPGAEAQQSPPSSRQDKSKTS
jgi:hypothetical protein